MKPLQRILSIIMLAALFTACAKKIPAPTPTAALEDAPQQSVSSSRFETAPCRFTSRGGENSSALTCGDLIVPANRSDPNGSTFKLHVAVVKSASDEPKKDPMVLLAGEISLLPMAGVLGYFFGDLMADRDLIVFDERGVGFSSLPLNCSEVDQLNGDSYMEDLTSAAWVDRVVDANRTCRDRLAASGVHFENYSPAANAADLEDLRLALGYKQWNLYAMGEGTRVALEAMRTYPQGLRSVVLDSPMPFAANPFTDQPAAAGRSIEHLFQTCVDDEACRTTYPELSTAFYEQVDKLNSSPVTVQGREPTSGSNIDVLATGTRLLEAGLGLAIGSGAGASLPEFPRMVYHLRSGNRDLLGNYMIQGFGGNLQGTSGLSAVTTCNVDFDPAAKEKISSAGVNPVLQEYFMQQFRQAASVCDVWKVDGFAAPNRQPVTGSVPTLVLASKYNWQILAVWADLTAQSLSKVYQVTLPNTGEMPSISMNYSVCVRSISKAFLNQPDTQPEVNCAAGEQKITWITLP